MQDFFANCATVLQKYGFSYLRGAGTTLLLALVGTFFGCLIGFAVGALQTIPVDKQRDPVWKRVLLKILHIFLRCYVELFRGTPMIVQAVFIYYGLLQVFGIKMGMWQAGFFIVSINTGAYMAETVRGGIVSIDPGQTEGAKAIGMNHWQTMIHVILPQALRNIIPQIGNNFIINIKDTSVLSVISITDLFFVHKSVVGALYTYFESAAIVMVIYLTMTLFGQLSAAPVGESAGRPAELRPEHHRLAGLHQRYVQRPGPEPRVPESGYEGKCSPCLSLLSRCAISPRASAPTLSCVTLTLPSTRVTSPASSVRPAAANPHCCAASTCWRRPRTAKYCSTATTSPPRGLTPAPTAPRWAWCSRASTCSTT